MVRNTAIIIGSAHVTLIAACALLAVPASAETDSVAVSDGSRAIVSTDDAVPEATADDPAERQARNGWVEVSAFFPAVDSRLLISAANGPAGTEIDLERDLRLNRRRTLPAISAGIRLDRSWSLFAEFYEVDRSRNTTIAKDIVFDGVVYPASAAIRTEFDSSIYRIGASYSVYRDANTQFDVSLGAHVTQFSTSIEGEVIANGNATAIERRRRAVLAPLPTIGIFTQQEILPRVDLSLRADAFSLALGEFEGRILNLQAMISYRLNRRMQLGLSYRKIDYNLKIDKDDWTGRAKYSFSGPAASLRWSW